MKKTYIVSKYPKYVFGRRKSTKTSVYKTVIDSFKSQGFTFEQDDENCTVLITFSGDDLRIPMFIKVHDLHVGFVCYLPFKADESRYKDVAWRLNEINLPLSFGSFEIDPEDGVIQFGYGYIFSDANPSEELILSIISMIIQTVDEFDGELAKIANRMVRDTSDSMMFG